MNQKPLIGISSCLLGDEVRFNGGHKKFDWIVSDLGKHVQWVSRCPEMAMGLGVPRESMRLKRFKKGGPISLVGVNTEQDFTEIASNFARLLVSELPPNLNGYVLKNASPSCGLEKVKVYGPTNIPFKDGIGFFAKELIRKFPEIPTIEEGRLNNPVLREHFVTRVFAHHAISKTEPEISQIQKLHESYKFVIQAHHEPSLRVLGRIAANSKKEKPENVLKAYRKKFIKALEYPSSVGKRSNVVQHIYGFVKDKVTAREKKNILTKIEAYRKGNLPYAALLVLIHHIIDRHEVSYIEKQRFFSPYPENLNLYHRI